MDLTSEFDRLRALPKGWDSHGGKPVREDSIAAATKFVRWMLAHPKPEITVTSGGEVVLTWRRGAGCEQELDVTFCDDGRVEIIATDEDAVERHDHPFVTAYFRDADA